MSHGESDTRPATASNSATSKGGRSECFVIAPLDDPGTKTRKRTDGLLEYVIRPVVEEETGLEVIAPHEIDKPGHITRQVMRLLVDAELVLADLTECNPNVMYELAIRHALGKPVVLVAEESTNLPFDIGPQRTEFYEDTMSGPDDFIPDFRSAVKEALKDDHQPDNPFVQVRKDKAVYETSSVEGADHILERLDQMESRISSPPTGIHSGNRISLRATGDIVANKEELPDDVLLVKGDVIAGGAFGTHRTSPFKEIRAFYSPKDDME